jgi:hypothetical protein
MLELSIQSDLDQVSRMAHKRKAAKAKKSGSGKSAKGADLDEVPAFASWAYLSVGRVMMI